MVARMAGAASALAPVAKMLLYDDLVSPVIAGFEHAESVFREHGLPLWAFEEKEQMSASVDQILQDAEPKLVLTGTSAKPKLDLALWSQARAKNIPTVAVLDHWMNYSERFVDEEGSYRSSPDVIAVMDQVACNEMLASGCPRERLIVTGQPAFDEFTNLTYDREQQLRQSARTELAVDAEEKLLVFASDPRAGPSLQRFLQAAEKACVELSYPVQVIVKLHPLEATRRNAVAKLNQLLSVHSLRHFPQLKLVAACDLVVGTGSVLVLEAALTGKKTISIQPKGSRVIGFPDHLRSMIERTEDVEGCAESIVRSLKEEKSACQHRRELALSIGFDGKASYRVSKLVYDLLGMAPALTQTDGNNF